MINVTCLALYDTRKTRIDNVPICIGKLLAFEIWSLLQHYNTFIGKITEKCFTPVIPSMLKICWWDFIMLDLNLFGYPTLDWPCTEFAWFCTVFMHIRRICITVSIFSPWVTIWSSLMFVSTHRSGCGGHSYDKSNRIQCHNWLNESHTCLETNIVQSTRKMTNW